MKHRKPTSSDIVISTKRVKNRKFTPEELAEMTKMQEEYLKKNKVKVYNAKGEVVNVND